MRLYKLISFLVVMCAAWALMDSHHATLGAALIIVKVAEDWLDDAQE